MKKIVSILLSITMVMTFLASVPLTVQEELTETTIDNITYQIDSETGEASVLKADSEIVTANIKS